MFLMKLGKELFFFAVTVSISLLFWFVLANLTDQCITVKDWEYLKEKIAFFVTIALIYFVRLSTWAVRPHSTSN